MLGHNSFDFALTPTNRVFMANVTTSGIYKWTNGKWADGQAPNWTTDTRTWDYEGYTITQTSHKTQHDLDSGWVFNYRDTVIATDKDGKQIHEIKGPTLTYDDKTSATKFSKIDPNRNILANAMQADLDNYLSPSAPSGYFTPSAPNSGSGGGTTGSEDTDPNDCASENRNVNTDETCGDCISGYSEDDDSNCVIDEPEDEPEEEKKTNWLLYGGIAAVAVFALMA